MSYGYIRHKCACGISYAVIDSESGYGAHSFQLIFTIDKEATFLEAGEKSHHCRFCGIRTDITVIPKKDINTDLDFPPIRQ